MAARNKISPQQIVDPTATAGNVPIYDAFGCLIDSGQTPGSGVFPQDYPNVPTEFLNSYDATTGLFTSSVPSGGSGGGTVPTSGWTAHNGIVYNDFHTPSYLGATFADSAGLNWRFITQSLSGASTYTLIATILDIQAAASSYATGLYLFDGTKIIGLELLSQATGLGGVNRLRVERMNSVTSDNATQAGPTLLTPALATLKIVKDATNRTFYYWTAGAWTQFYQEAASAFLTETDVGFGGVSVTASNNVNYAELRHWSLT